MKRRKPRVDKIATIATSVGGGVLIEITSPDKSLVSTIARPSQRAAEEWLEKAGYVYEKDLVAPDGSRGAWMKIDFDGARSAQLVPCVRAGVRLR